MRVAVVVPTYRRPELLRRCLGALSAQTYPADQIVVVHREGDADSTRLLQDWASVMPVAVRAQGVVAAMRAGVVATDTDIVAFTDDDAAPRIDWLRILVRHLDDPCVGGVGGRDIVDHPTQIGRLTPSVGKLGAWGAIAGNHHLGCGPPRDVSVLKGVNMAFRRDALALPSGLRGMGAQVDFELACCLSASAQRWRLIYDPMAMVDHTVGPRFDRDQRERPDPIAISDAAYNRLAIMLALRPGLGLRRAGFGLLVGEGATPGLLRATVALIRGERDVVRRLRPSLSGQADALADAACGRRVRMMTPPDYVS